VRGTYRLNYTQDPNGQWQGYTDGADPARAWGVSEWAHRAGQALTSIGPSPTRSCPKADAATPGQPGKPRPHRTQRIRGRNRRIAAGLYEIQIAMDEANGGVNPLGFDADAITAFDHRVL
jgi:hypothetical protein